MTVAQKEITQKGLDRLLQECKSDLKRIGVPISKYIQGGVFVNNCKSSLGRCRKFGVDMFQIQISKYLLKCDKELIKNTIYHELIHSIPKCFNHGYNFCYYANMINKMLGANVVIKNRDKQFGEQLQYKYKITCKKCHAVFYRHKLPKYRIGLKHASDNGELIIEQLY